VLPYLRYIKQDDYCHIFSVDLTPLIFDASAKRDGTVAQPGSCTDSEYWNCTKTENSWRTILVGGMRFGGACRNSDSTCTNCVKAPGVDIDSSGSVDTSAEKNLGSSSYFALDITDQDNPVLLWEWDGTVLNAATGAYENRLGLTTSGAAAVKINARKVIGAEPTSTADTTKNGRWFVVVGSGPTGPISTSDAQFLGRSDQNLRIFIMDAVAGPSSLHEFDTGIQEAFAGSMINANDDVDLDYQDDAVYIPYVKSEITFLGKTWTRGGVVRLLTKEDLNGTTVATTALSPANWTAARVMDNIGPVTSAVVRLHNTQKKQHWVYVGEGRYYFEQGANTDDATSQRKIMGFKDPCYTISGFDLSCTTLMGIGSLVDVTNIANVPSDPDAFGYNGWYINMDAAGNYTYVENGTTLTRAYRAERAITDPVATTSGVAFFTTYKPYNDECALGGKSFIWAAKYDTGGAPGALLKGKGLVQVSTGSIEQIDLSSAFTEAGGRKTTSIEGVPPTQSGLSILTSPPPVKRTIHFRER
jgi:type IV pilus assembly protein PilY1